MASDMVVFTLKEQAITFKGEQSQVLFIYDTLFQSGLLLSMRCLLCVYKEYWLVIYSVIYFVI